MATVAWHRLRRVADAGSPLVVTVAGAAIAAFASIAPAVSPASPAGAQASHWPYLGIGVVAIGFVLLAFQWRAEYRKRTYDPKWALTFDDRFDAQEMRRARRRAAKELLENKNHLKSGKTLAAVDDVLDFFEDLGFYMEGDQVTPEVVHNAFHYWVQGYYGAAREYITTYRHTAPAAWDHIALLFEASNAIERERVGRNATEFLSAKDQAEFLKEEAELSVRDKTE